MRKHFFSPLTTSLSAASDLDPRTNDWPLIKSPVPGLTILGLYLYFVNSWGPRFMKDRKPFQFKNTLLVYNFVQVLISVYLFTEVSGMRQRSSAQLTPIALLTHYRAWTVDGWDTTVGDVNQSIRHDRNSEWEWVELWVYMTQTFFCFFREAFKSMTSSKIVS